MRVKHARNFFEIDVGVHYDYQPGRVTVHLGLLTRGGQGFLRLCQCLFSRFRAAAQCFVIRGFGGAAVQPVDPLSDTIQRARDARLQVLDLAHLPCFVLLPGLAASIPRSP